jgi:type I restriction enzyme S subunit
MQNLNMGFGAFCKVLRPNSKVDHAYFAHFFKTRSYRQKVSSLAAGANINNLRNEHLDDLPFPLPPLEEQRRIAAILDQTETLRTQRRTALALLDSLTQSLFLDMFGEGDSHRWPVTSIGEIVDEENGGIRTGPFGSQLLHSEFVDEGVAVLGIDNAVNNEFRWSERRYITHAKYEDLKRYTVRPGDVLITIMGTCGRCAVVPEDIPLAINTKHLCCISVDRKKVVPDYLHAYFLRHPTARKYLEQTAKGAIMSGLNMGIIKAMPIALPPLPLQQTFATRIAAIEALQATHRRALAAQGALFASLQQRAFAGQL